MTLEEIKNAIIELSNKVAKFSITPGMVANILEEMRLKIIENFEISYSNLKKSGDLSKLYTDDKSDLVSAINETYARGGGGGDGGTTDYIALANKPRINDVILKDNKTLDELGIQKKISSISETNEGNTILISNSSVRLESKSKESYIEIIEGEGIDIQTADGEFAKINGHEISTKADIVNSFPIDGILLDNTTYVLTSAQRSIVINSIPEDNTNGIDIYFRTTAFIQDFFSIPANTKIVGEIKIEAEKNYVVSILNGVCICAEITIK